MSNATQVNGISIDARTRASGRRSGGHDGQERDRESDGNGNRRTRRHWGVGRVCGRGERSKMSAISCPAGFYSSSGRARKVLVPWHVLGIARARIANSALGAPARRKQRTRIPSLEASGGGCRCSRRQQGVQQVGATVEAADTGYGYLLCTVVRCMNRQRSDGYAGC